MSDKLGLAKQMEKVKISQSLLKRMRDYIDGNACGLQIKAQYIDGVRFPASDAQRLGQWFEYKCTGGLPAYGDGTPPIPDTLKPKKATKKQVEEGVEGLFEEDGVHYIQGELSSKYRLMEKQVENFNNAIKYYGVKILEVGKKLEFGKARGDCDIFAEMYGKEAIIDIKATGLFNNKWDDLGWGDIANEYRPKEKILTQAIHYKYLAKNILGIDDIPFYFWVFSTIDPSDFKIIKVDVDEDDYLYHSKEINDAYVFLKKQLEYGFKANPHISNCSKCPIKESCSHYSNAPKVEQVYYTTKVKL
jgi:hypothetical protein